MATSAGVRVPACMIPAPSRMRDVRAARKASGVTASWPQDSRGPDGVDAEPLGLHHIGAACSQSRWRQPEDDGDAHGLRRGAGDLPELTGVVEVVQPHEQQRLAPVQRAEHGMRDRAVEARRGSARAAPARSSAARSRSSSRQPLVERAARRRLTGRDVPRRAGRPAVENAHDAVAEVRARLDARAPSPRWRSTRPGAGRSAKRAGGTAAAAAGARPSPPAPSRRCSPGVSFAPWAAR